MIDGLSAHSTVGLDYKSDKDIRMDIFRRLWLLNRDVNTRTLKPPSIYIDLEEPSFDDGAKTKFNEF